MPSVVLEEKGEESRGSRFEVLDLEEMDVVGGERTEEKVPGVINSVTDPIEPRQLNMARVDNPDCDMGTSEAKTPTKEGTNLLETISTIVGQVCSIKSCEEDVRAISLDKISILPKDNN